MSVHQVAPRDSADARPGGAPLHTLFERQCERTPSRTAVTCGDRSLSYAELDELANRVAGQLRSIGAGRDSLVAVWLDRSLDLIAGILGVLKSGAAYVPIDLDCPRERMAFILRDASAAALLTHANLVDGLPTSAPRVVVVDGSAGPAVGRLARPSRVGTPDDSAYVIYTSGSTGTPKGVLVEHGSVGRMLRACDEVYQFGEDDVWTMFHSAAFDVSVWELWGALLCGGRLVVVPRAVARSPVDFHALCVREGVTVLSQTPSAFVPFIQADAAAPDAGRRLSLRYVILGGEALDFQVLRPWFEAHGDAHPRLFNMYGPTETSVWATCRPLTRADAAPTTGSLIGAPLRGYRIRLVDAGGRPVPEGTIGEIVIGGVWVARGYLNRPELTAERFADGLDAAGSGRRYRSGDLGRVLASGDLEFVGRLDHQVKIRGFRVELGEIESVIGSHAAVVQCVVLAREDRPGDKRLVVYWTANVGARATADDLRAHVAARLPEYMVPSVFVELAAMPLTINGKLDRQTLPAPGGARSDGGAAFEAPCDELESGLVALWRDVLGVGSVGVRDNFFEMGGHSLLAFRLAQQVERRFGARLPVSQIFEQPTIAALAPVVRRLGGVAGSMATVPLPTAPPVQPHPSPSFAQQGVWFHEHMAEAQRAYLLTDVWELRGALDEESLRRAFETIVHRHAPLRTRFEIVANGPGQVIDEPRRFELATRDLRSLPPAEQQAEVTRLTAVEADRPFDLATDLLLRAGLVALDSDCHVLIVSVHHIASDGWSQLILRRELQVLYESYRRDVPPALDDLPVQYADLAARERADMTPERESRLLQYWRRQLSGLPRLDLPCDRPRPPVWSDRGGEHEFVVPQDLSEGLQRVATVHQATMQMLLLAAWQTLLSRYSGQLDFAVAIPTAGRTHAAAEPLIGLFVNTLVLRADFSGAPSFVEVLRRVRTTSMAAYDHQELPFETVVAELRGARDRSRSPIAEVMFQFFPLSDAPPLLDGLAVTALPRYAQRVRLDLEMLVRPEGPGLRGLITYRTDLFDHQTIERLAGNFVTLLEAIVADPDRPASELRLLTEAEREELLVEWSGRSAPPAERGLVHDLFTAQAARTPEAMAIVFGDQRISYGQLADRSDRLAQHLRSVGVRAADTVAIHGDRSIGLIVAMLGVLKAGAAYVPLDPAYPVDRLAFMMRDLDVTSLVACGDVPPTLSALARRCVGLGCASEIWATSPAGPVSIDVRPMDLAYVMFTSGSTGQPKGVAVPHEAVTRLVRRTNYIQLLPTDRIAQASNASFDASTLEIWGALLNGAQLVGLDRDTLLSPTGLAEAIREHSLTVLFLTTTLFHQMASVAPGIFATLRYLVVGGEVLNPNAARAVLAAGPPQHLLNGYGPTENTTFSTTFELTSPLDDAPVPIGRPIASSTCYVLDSKRALQPCGAVGELYVGGAGLATGYLRRPDLTDERFVAHPFVDRQRLYRTGDRVRWRWDGHLQFLGRTDGQVKLRGHRIEIGEIDHALSLHPGVRQCAVVVREDRGGDKRLVAYWVDAEGTAATPEDLRAHARRTLPDYMVPSALVRVPSLPLTVNGKLDGGALPDPFSSDESMDADSVPPSTDLETLLAPLWSEVLGLERVGIHADFFELGGHSLSALRLAARIKEACGQHVSIAGVLANPTVARMAVFLETRNAHQPGSIIEMRGGGARAPIYFPPGLFGETQVHEAFLEALPPDQPICAFDGDIDAGTLTPSIETIAARLCAAVTAHQSEGPMALAGYSFGGILAYEMARQLRHNGREVKCLVILDTGPDPVPDHSVKARLESFWLFVCNVPRWIRDDSIFPAEPGTPARLGRSLRKLLRALIPARGTRERAEGLLEDIFDVSKWPSERRAYANISLRALEAYRFGPYSGRLVLLRARTRPLFSSHQPDLGWRTVVPAVDVVSVPGNHHTMLMEPHVREVARALSEALDG